MKRDPQKTIDSNHSAAAVRTSRPGGAFLARLAGALRDEQGTASIEYALLLSLTAVATIGVWLELGGKVQVALVTLTDSISQPLP